MGLIKVILGITVSIIITPIAMICVSQLVRISIIPSSLPWVGLDDRRIFPKLRAQLNEFFVGRKPLDDGYEKYSKQDKPFVLPGMHWPEITLPPSQTRWLISQPENVISGIKAQDDMLALRYFTAGSNVASIHDFSVIRRDLTQRLNAILPDVFDEVVHTLDESAGLDEDWREVDLVETVRNTSMKAANRIFVGLPYCRDKRFLDRLWQWTLAFSLSGAIYRWLTPDVLKPMLGFLLAPGVKFMERRASTMFMPLLCERLALAQQANSEGRLAKDPSRPNDMLQWVVENAVRKNDPAEMDVWTMGGKLVLFNAFAVHTISMSASTLIVNLLSPYVPKFDASSNSTPSEILSSLRVEAASILPRISAEPTAIREMVKLDSAIRESLRRDPPFGRGIMREVVAPNGVTLPDGTHLPRGCHVGAAVSSMQRDQDFCTGDAMEFDPLRFYNQACQSGERQKGAVQIGEHFLSFSLGKHACPGRFFAVDVLKLIVGHLLINYDLELLQERPKAVEVGDIVMVSEKTKIKIRRRSKSQ